MLGSESNVVEELQHLDGEASRELRREVVEILFDSVPCDFALYYTFVLHEGRCHYTAVTPVGDDELCRRAESLEGVRADIAEPWDPRAPDPDETNRFVAMEFDPERLIDRDESSILQQVYGRGRIAAQTRALMYEDERLMGWIGMMRRRDEPFGQRTVDILNRVLPALRAALGTAHRSGEELTDPVDFVLEPGGPSVEYASEQARSWLSPASIDELTSLVQRTEREQSLPAVVVYEGCRLRIARLDGALGARYSVTIEQFEPPRLGPKAQLTPRQREVAEYAAAGATAAEIADTLEISTATVHDHIRSIYERLGIGSRAELASLIAP